MTATTEAFAEDAEQERMATMETIWRPIQDAYES
jgi:hypothetical protein